ncbi:phosphoglycolate phosphatase [Leeia sp. TBRC 13508]|uniref:Phosphoglycolate phosphatase n=1 Tax=Leeia speluncae TaxID=2884804 RepID=A0ABS8D2H1_9NEIS|nr:phosphoglycolate phosphatase [Leeia speluncae]MCB6182173.1 phosphoglycolate phosphatase [Leeia speluncae]
MAFPYKAVAFDLDGTLVDSIADLAAAANAVRLALNLPVLPQDTVESFVGDGAASLVARVLAGSKAAEPDEASVLQKEGMALFNRFYLEKLTIKTKPYTTVVDTLRTFKSGKIGLACVTNKPARFTLPLLEQLGLAEFFDVVIAGDSLPQKKPHALPLTHTAEVLNVKPAEMLMVGDSENDVLSAKAAGCPVAAVSYGYAADANALGADLIIHQMDALLALSS